MDLLNYNMKVSEVWKEQMIDMLSLIYRDESIEKITNFVNKIYRERYKEATMDVRNIYQYTTGKVNPDDTLINIFGPKQKLLGANGTLMDNHEENPAPTLILIGILKKDRKVFKDAMLKAKGEGNDDEEETNKRESNAVKIINNAIDYILEGQARSKQLSILTKIHTLVEMEAKVKALRSRKVEVPILFVPPHIKKSQIYFVSNVN